MSRGDSDIGQDYHQITEEEQTRYFEEEEYDAEFARGPIVSLEDRTHPLVVRGYGTAPGRMKLRCCRETVRLINLILHNNILLV